MAESRLQSEILSALGTRPEIMVLRINSGLFWAPTMDRRVRSAPQGTPDVLVLGGDGRAVWLEVKTPCGRLTPAQERWHRRARAVGQVVAVVRSVDEAREAVAHLLATDSTPRPSGG